MDRGVGQGFLEKHGIIAKTEEGRGKDRWRR